MTREQLIDKYVEAHADSRWLDAGEMRDLLNSFADELMPSLPEGLDEAAGEYLDGHKPLSRYNWGDLMDAFKAGARWRDAQIPKLPDNVDEAARKYAEERDYWWHTSQEYAFKAGAEWGEKNAYKTIMKKADGVREKRFYTDFEVKFEPAAGFDVGCVNVYHEGKLVGQYVEPKEEKKLPEGLDEAAEKLFPEKRQYVSEFGTIEYVAPWVSSEKAAFKAGAEWMAEQGYTQKCRIKADYDSHGADYGIRYLYVRMPDDSPIGEEVIVQIRKI